MFVVTFLAAGTAISTPMTKLSRNSKVFSIVLFFFLGVTYLQHNKLTSITTSNFKTLSIPSVEPYGEIPKQIFFTYRHNIITTRDPTHLYNNVRRTIDSYRNLWNESNAAVHFLEDERCVEEIVRSVPSESEVLLNFYFSLTGPFKGDICRVAALYLHGGYYFDVDLEVIEPFAVPENTYFVTVDQPAMNNFFQAFVASTPRHPILKKNLEKIIALAKGEIHLELVGPNKVTFVGPETMKMAYEETPERFHKSSILLLESRLENLGGEEYDAIPRQDGEGPNCNWVVHDPEKKRVYFYSRMIGSGKQCMTRGNEKAKKEVDGTDQTTA